MVVGTVVDVAAAVFGTAVLTFIVVTVVLVARGRPPRSPGTLPDRRYRVRGRSMAGWQRSAVREIRRAGRPNRRGRPRN